MSKTNILVQKRKFIRKSVTEQHNRRTQYASYTRIEKEATKSNLTGWLSELKKLDQEILDRKSEDWEEKDFERKFGEEVEISAAYEWKINECLAHLQEDTSLDTSSRQGTDVARSLLKSPTAPLPTYHSKEDEDLLRFFEQFEETIKQFNYVDYDKLTLLKQQVSGRALLLINSLDSDKRTYPQAKALLIEALASRDKQIFSLIKQVTELKLKGSDDPFEYISKMKLYSERVGKLKLDADGFLRYFFWEGLNESFKKHLVQITNHTKPTLEEIRDNFFEAAERYMTYKDIAKKETKPPERLSKPPERLSSLAATVEYPKKEKDFKACSICSKEEGKQASHPIFKCKKYQTAEAKVNKLKSFNACIKCSGIEHNSDCCKYKFHRRCNLCSEWHFNFLCVKPRNIKVKNKAAEVKDKTLSKETSSHLCVMEALNSNLNGSAILPTFQFKINDEIMVRGLKDGGCQYNLISSRIADKLDLKIIDDNIPLTVNGINCPRNYHSKLVEMEILLGNNKHVVTAFCLPAINISLNLPHLGEIAQKFSFKGYSLADPGLMYSNDVLTDIDFILGTKFGYCLPETEILLGTNSLYSNTPMGIMLKGDTVSLLDNLEVLHYKDNKTMDTCGFLGNLNELDSNLHCDEKKQVEEEVSVNVSVINGEILESEIDKATQQILEEHCSYYNNVDNNSYNETSTDVNLELIKFALGSMTREDDGRICVPLLWNSKVAHLLGKNRNLAQAVLRSNLNKLKKNQVYLELMDDVFREQEEVGIVKRIENIDSYLKEHPEHSFLPHMGVFKLDRETTKCRVVYLSNLCEPDPCQPLTVSHNQAIHSGPSLNQKLSTSLLHLRFGAYLLCFDLKKAFNTLALNEIDSNRLLCLWFKNIKKGDFTVIGYRNVRLSFGLRCSPALLLLALYKILVLDTESDSERICYLKKLIYSLTYMDNCAITAEEATDLEWCYEQLNGIFEPYQFGLQQFMTNFIALQKRLDNQEEKETPKEVKLLGINWNRETDELSTKPINLDKKANTKRSILSSIAAQFDVYNFNGPLLNRARFFLHTLQTDKDLEWDKVLDESRLKEWQNIVKQANSSPVVKIKRFVGSKSHSYRLIGCSDSSRQAYGLVVYIHNLDTNEVNFVMAKNRLIGKELSSKSIPSLELKGISFATECMIDIYKELAGPSCLLPIKVNEILILTDSLVTLSWINSYSQTMDKMQKKPTFILNRLEEIKRLCETFPVTYAFISGVENPGDCITRSLSYRQLMKTNYLKGMEDFLNSNIAEGMQERLSVTVPNPLILGINHDEIHSLHSSVESYKVADHLNLLVECSDFNKLIRTYRRGIFVIDRWKCFLKSRNPTKYAHLITKPTGYNFFKEAGRLLLQKEQEAQYPEVCTFFNSPHKLVKDIPNIVNQLNVFKDSDGLLRVRSKLGKLQQNCRYNFPLLLAKKSRLTKLIIMEYHLRFAHAGCYSLLSELRKQFWIPHYFSVVKKSIKSCVHCRRFNERTIKLNQSDYREFRADPPTIPFRTIFMDYLGPFSVRINKEKSKVWLLCITCTWCRAVNLKICMDMSVQEFLRAFQIHCFEYGVPEYCISDLGSQLVAGSNIIMDFLKDSEAKNYFDEFGMKPTRFEQFNKGCSQLGSMVEICVKLTKRLLFGSIKNNVLSYRDFEFFICKTVHLINRRPIAFKEALRDSSLDVPDPITPELLVRGYSLPSINVIPELQSTPNLDDPDWQPKECPSSVVRSKYEKLKRVRDNLIDLYHSEFISTLMSQAVNVKDRYKPVKHQALRKGDIVLLKENFSKPSQYPMGIVKELTKNTLGEVTGAVIMKGKNREVVKRHASTVILLLSPGEEFNSDGLDNKLYLEGSEKKQSNALETNNINLKRSKRKAAIVGREKVKNWCSS